MTTPRSRALVSLAARMTLVTLALGACAPSRPVLDGPAPTEGHRPAIGFDNAAPRVRARLPHRRAAQSGCSAASSRERSRLCEFLKHRSPEAWGSCNSR